MWPTTLSLTPKEAEIIRDGIESGSLADGLADTEGDALGLDGWRAVEIEVGRKIDGGRDIQVDNENEAVLIERAFSDSTLFTAYPLEEPARKAAMRRVAGSLQQKLSIALGRRPELPIEFT